MLRTTSSRSGMEPTEIQKIRSLPVLRRYDQVMMAVEATMAPTWTIGLYDAK